MNSEEEEIPAIELGDFPQSQVRDALERVLTSPEFVRSKRISAFLRYVVEETLAGRGDRLKAFTIAMDVYERDESFDPRTDTIVRVEASRLRRRLEHYYENAGRDAPVRIELLTGGYKPKFCARNRAENHIDGESGKNRRDETFKFLGRRRPPARAIALFVALVIASIGIAVWWFARPQEINITRLPKIAVLQFSDISGDPSNVYLARGFTSELVAALAGFRHMVVVSRATSTLYKNINADPREIGHDLSAQFLIRGTLWKDKNRLNVSVELADTQSSEIVWSKKYDEPLVSANSFEISASIAGQIARAVAKPYGAVYREMVRSTTAADFSSYRCVLEAYSYKWTINPKLHRTVRDCLESTVEQEPRYAAAWVLLTYIYLDEFRHQFNVSGNYNAIDRAMEAARRAVQLIPENSQAHLALAECYYFLGEIRLFQESGERALELGANNADVVADFGFKLAISGQWERGLKLLNQAMLMSPVHPTRWYFPLALDQYRRKAYEDALATTLKIDIPKLYLTYVFRAMIYGQLGRAEDARTAMAEITKRKPNFAKNVRNDFLRRKLQETMIEHIVEGLQKAGLKIPSED